MEETCRDGQRGWGGRTVVVALPTATMVERLLGGGCWTDGVQMSVGQRRSAAPLGPRRRAQGTVTARGRWFWGGQRLCDDPGYDWRAWLATQWRVLIDRLVPVVDKAA
jgi:hypothetical protein